MSNEENIKRVANELTKNVGKNPKFEKLINYVNNYYFNELTENTLHAISKISKVKAKDLFLKLQNLANENNIDAMSILGDCYRFGFGTLIDERKCLLMYQKAALLNNGNAKYKLGLCYENGIGTKKDRVKAFKLYFAASKLGYPLGDVQIGIAYENGVVIEKNFKKAFGFYQKASMQNVPVSFYKLGEYYYYGKGVVPNQENAAKCYKKAIELGCLAGQNQLNMIESNTILNQAGSFLETKNYKKALACYKKAAEMGNVNALIRLAKIYEEGKITAQNLQESKRYLALANEFGFKNSKKLGNDFELDNQSYKR